MGADGNRGVARRVAEWGVVGAARYRTAHNRGGALPGRHAASAAHGSPERSLADLGKNVPKMASVGPRFDTFLPEKMEDLLVGRRISATTTSAGSSAPSARPRARRISRRCSMSCEPVTATKACPGRIPRAQGAVAGEYSGKPTGSVFRESGTDDDARLRLSMMLHVDIRIKPLKNGA